MNYKVIEALMYPETSETNCPIYKVIETVTDQIIMTFSYEKEAKDLMRRLNLGSGFDGFTPSFILQKVYPFTENTNNRV